MRFLKDGPSIPDELLNARDEGGGVFSSVVLGFPTGAIWDLAKYGMGAGIPNLRETLYR
jgi:hypothetical protein